MKNTVTRLLALLLALTLLLCCAAQAEPAQTPDETPESHTVEGVTYPICVSSPTRKRTPPRVR